MIRNVPYSVLREFESISFIHLDLVLLSVPVAGRILLSRSSKALCQFFSAFERFNPVDFSLNYAQARH